MDLKQLTEILVALGSPPQQAKIMAAQLDKRARQIAEAKGKSYEEALTHLLELLRNRS